MDLVDLIAEKRFIGQEFLTWLWYKSEERGGTVYLPGTGDIILVFEKHMLLEYGEGDAHERIICRGLQTELQEARTGLVMGKKLEQARISLAQGDYEWNLTLTATTLEFRNVKCPKTMADSEDNSLAAEAGMLDHLGMIEMAIQTITELFRVFIKIRISRDWDDELRMIRAWVHKPLGS